MKISQRKAGIFLFICLCLIGPHFVTNAQEEQPVVVIYHTGDTNGNMISDEDTIGSAEIASIFMETKDQTPASFLLDTGDSLQGNFFVNSVQGENVVAIMNAVGYDAMTLGNHEFDYGLERLKELANMAEFPFLTQESVARSIPEVQSSVILERGGIRIGVFGLTTPSAKYTSNGGFHENFGTVSELINDAVLQARKLREDGADIVICLSHLGVSVNQDKDYGSAYDIAENALGIDLIIDGHTPETDVVNQYSFTTPISSVSDNGSEIGKISFYLRDGVLVPEIEKIMKAETTDVVPDEAVEQLVQRYKEQSAELAKTVVSYSDKTINDFEKSVIRTQESILGDMVADSMRWVSGADIAFCNAGNVRGPIEKGDVTLEEIENMLPYSNNVMVSQVPGKVIREALERSASLYGKMDGGFLQVSGLSYTILKDPSIGGTLDEVLVNGEELSDEKEYTLAIFDFLAEGGDGYSIFPTYYQDGYMVAGGIISSIFAQYLSEKGAIQTELQGRIRITTQDGIANSRGGWLVGLLVLVLLGATVLVVLLLKKQGRLVRNEHGNE
jgi:5'-nucleotidase